MKVVNHLVGPNFVFQYWALGIESLTGVEHGRRVKFMEAFYLIGIVVRWTGDSLFHAFLLAVCDWTVFGRIVVIRNVFSPNPFSCSHCHGWHPVGNHIREKVRHPLRN